MRPACITLASVLETPPGSPGSSRRKISSLSLSCRSASLCRHRSSNNKMINPISKLIRDIFTLYAYCGHT